MLPNGFVLAMLDLWAENDGCHGGPTARNQLSRIHQIKADRIAALSISRLSGVDVDRWHSRLVKRGIGEGSIRIQRSRLQVAITLAVRREWKWPIVVGERRPQKLLPRVKVWRPAACRNECHPGRRSLGTMIERE